MDFIPGTNLSKVWNDNSWITDLKRQRIFEQIVGWMVELAAIEFDQIGCLDWDGCIALYRSPISIVYSDILRGET